MTQATNPGQFDYAMYYKSKSLLTHRCFAVSIELVDKKYNYIMQFLYQTRKAGLAVIDSICEEDDAGFLKASHIWR